MATKTGRSPPPPPPPSATMLPLLLLLAAASLRPCASFAPPPPSSVVARGDVRTSWSPSSSSGTRLFVDGQGTAAGTTRHLVGDVLRSLQPKYLQQVADAVQGNMKGMREINLSGLDDGTTAAPSWDDLSSRLVRAQSPAERRFRTDLEEGSGPPSALSNLRLFGHSEPRVVLYRDSASWCPYCQKAWIALEERRVPYEIRRVDMRCYGTGKPAEFLALQDSGNLPCAVIDGGMVIGESDDILRAVDAMGDDAKTRPLFPVEGTLEHDFMRAMCDDGRNSLERRLYTRWMYFLTGVRKPGEYRRLYEDHLDEADAALASSGGPYFLGKEFSVVDVKFAPFLERQEASLAYFQNFRLRDPERWPNLVRWLESMEGRESYVSTKSDWYTHSRALPPQLAADCVFARGSSLELKECVDAVPTSTSSSPYADWVEPGWDVSPKLLPNYRREAAERLIRNHEGIVRFACRGAGLPGLPASAAPLADPRCEPNGGAAGAVDWMARIVAENLLSSSGGKSSANAGGGAAWEAARSISAAGGGPDAADAVAGCLDYLRARVGVPRDMSYPAANELRRELRDAAEALKGAAAATDGAAAVEKEEGRKSGELESLNV